MKFILHDGKITAPSKDYIGKEDELAEKLGIKDYELVNEAPDLRTEADVIKQEIQRLESQITPRRIREAVLTEEGATWLANQEALIATERNKLTGE